MFQKPSSEEYRPENSQESDNIETVVGPSVVVEGDFASEGDILVKGTVSGSVKTDKKLTVQEGAKILANVKAGEALISGEVKGNVRVIERLELAESAKVLGDISCRILVVAGGALLQGKINMKGLDDLKGRSDKKKTLLKPKVKLVDN